MLPREQAVRSASGQRSDHPASAPFIERRCTHPQGRAAQRPRGSLFAPAGTRYGARMKSRPAPARVLRTIAAVAIVVLAVDQLSKWYVVELLELRHHLAIPVLPPFLTFRMAWNTGVNFGLFGGGPEATRWILVAISIAVSAALVWWVLRRQSPGLALGAGLVLGGAVGNAIDRVRYGAVADFLNTSCCGIDNPFSFNVADIAIFVGAVWIALKA